eukprot:1176998-Prorocentrum_minimum.AAC.2
MLTTDTCARATCAAAATALITSCAGIFSRRTNQTREARAYSHDGPIRRGKRGHILTTETNQTQEARVPAAGIWPLRNMPPSLRAFGSSLQEYGPSGMCPLPSHIWVPATGICPLPSRDRPSPLQEYARFPSRNRSSPLQEYGPSGICPLPLRDRSSPLQEHAPFPRAIGPPLTNGVAGQQRRGEGAPGHAG